MALIEYAKTELERAGLLGEDSDYNGELGTAVLSLMEIFTDQGHSGASADMAVGLFQKLARFEPIMPLTGEDDEWFDPGAGNVLQNKRCPRIFKDKETGEAYDIDGKAFRDEDGALYTNGDSRVPVTFPYEPHTEIVDE